MTVEIRRDLRVATRGAVDLRGDAYLPERTAGDGATTPAFVLLHGGAWTKGRRESYDPWGRWLAGLGYVALTADYRLASPGRPSFPEAIHDVRAAVRYLRANAESLAVDPARIGLIGGSAGAHLAAMVALTARSDALPDPPDEPMVGVDSSVSVVVGMAGTYDLLRIWEYDRVARPVGEVPTESFIGGTPMSHRRAYYEASPLFHASTENVQGTSWLLAWGTEDDVVQPDQSTALSAALKRAGALVRHVPIVGAPHYWYLENGPEDAGSFSEFVARRLGPFLSTWRDR